MGRVLLAAALMLIALAMASAQRELRCEAGPVEKTFAETPWLLYACDDAESLIVVSDETNPAAPFYFLVLKTEDGYEITGEGMGSEEASQAAYAELTALPEPEIQALVAEALAASVAPAP